MNIETIKLIEIPTTDYLTFVSKEKILRHADKTIHDDIDIVLEEIPYDYVWHTHKHSRKYFFISTDKGIAGYLIVLRNDQNFLDGLYIIPRFRRNRIAREAVKLSGTNMCMVKSHNFPAIALYESLGFKLDRVLEEHGERKDKVTGTLFKYQIMKKM